MKKNDDGLSSVVGEMLLLVTALILVAVFAVSLLSILPGDRVDTAEISAKINLGCNTVSFYHKGGDRIGLEELKLTVFNGAEKRAVTFQSLTLPDGQSASVFALGSCLTYTVPGLTKGDDISLISDTGILYSGVVS